MLTNTYLPHVGGVANSVDAFSKKLKETGHRVVIIAPEFKGRDRNENDVVRINAIQNFNGSDFSVILPVPHFLERELKGFVPDIIHSHHPFLIGSIAVRLAAKFDVPLVFTQHTKFEEYLHYVPLEAKNLKDFVTSLSTGYADLCDRVIAPSQSIKKILQKRNVKTPIDIVPTGVNIDNFKNCDGSSFRKKHNIPAEKFVLGHIGRLAEEKNLWFLCKSVSQFLKKNSDVHFMIVGYGPMEQKIKNFFRDNNLTQQLHFIGKQTGQQLFDAYNSMDIFVFTSKSETQGMVVTEAMAAGVPVIAIDATGVREVVKNNCNGILADENKNNYLKALNKYYCLSESEKEKYKKNALQTAQNLSLKKSTAKLIGIYQQLINNTVTKKVRDETGWKSAVERIKTEWELFTNFTSSVSHAIGKNGNKKKKAK